MVTFSTDLTIAEINNDINGRIMYIHDSYELPSSFSKIMSMNAKANIEIYLEPQHITIDKSLYEADISERNCFHPDERQLKIFNVYTKNNCLVEFLADFMIEKCGCVEFFMIRNYTTRICSASEKECFDNAQQEFDIYLNSCNCLEPCSYIKYMLDIVKKPNIYDKFYDEESFTLINIQYKNSFIDELVRKRQFNEVDFLSFVGGLLGLFAGFSALSFIEIFYWTFASIYEKFKIKNTSLVYLLKTQFSFKTSKKFSNVLQKFFKNSSIHGLLYLNEESSFKKFFWMIFIATSLSLCFTMIPKVKDELSDSYIVEYDDEMTFDEEIKFPAIIYLSNFYIDKYFVFKIMGNFFKKNELNEILIKNSSRDKLMKKVAALSLCYHKFVYKLYSHTLDVTEQFYESLLENSQEWFQEQLATCVNDEFFYKSNISMVKQKSMPKISKEKFPLKVKVKDRSQFQLLIQEPKFKNQRIAPCIKRSVMIHDSELIPRLINYDEFIKIDISMDFEIIPEITKQKLIRI